MSELVIPNLKVALYARVSSEEQKEGQTIDSQVAELERFTQAQGWQVFNIYKDEGWSGATLARPGLDKMRDEAKKGSFNAVLINDVDRLARDVAHLGIIKRDLEKNGMRVIFRKLPAENSPTANLMVNILGSFAEFEREMILDRTRRGRKYKVEVRKLFLGAIPAYGYSYTLKDKANGKEGCLEIIPEQAMLVKQMYDWVDKEGSSAHQVVQKLNALGVKPRKGGKSWGKTTVIRILRNEIYAGVWQYNKHKVGEPLNTKKHYDYTRPKKSARLRPQTEWIAVPLPEHLRIIEREQWERVQKQITGNRVLSKRNSIHFYLLKGLVRCGGCNSTYVGDPCHGEFYYRCHKRCKAYPSITQHILESAVWDAVTKALLNPKLILEKVGKLIEQQNSNQEKKKKELEQVNASLTQIDQEESRILEAYRLGVFSSAVLGKEMENINGRRKMFSQKKDEMLAKLAEIAPGVVEYSVTSYCQMVAEKLENLTEENQQKLLNLIVDKVIFLGKEIKVNIIIPFVNEEPTNNDEKVIDKMADSQAGFVNFFANGIENQEVKQQGYDLSIEGNSTENKMAYHCVFSPSQKSLSIKGCIENTIPIKYYVHNPAKAITLDTEYYVENSSLKGMVLSVYNLVKLNPKPYLGDYKLLLEEFLLKHPNARLTDLCDHLEEHTGIKVSFARMFKVAKKHNLTYLKRSRKLDNFIEPSHL